MTSEKSANTHHDDINDGRIVSFRHLVSDRCGELSELEYALIMTSNAFNKWMVRCMTAAGEPDMGAFDVSLLHHMNHRISSTLALRSGFYHLEKTGWAQKVFGQTDADSVRTG
ncbi:TPA: hypothetical protein MEB24_004935 [Klebsiella aerogenes]|nr:hypothetical protein D0884_26450 [Klebsiella pneumoniae]ELQ9025940.1 hypothetical protein [Klebsiella oxytoca]MBD0763386.1 hypothetical protein [Klebsiella variicola]HBW0112753.1 hypothetical protein [Klebsiella aerogenes]HAV0434183.1 hypothetical protein [Klebsiella oxytoca]